jgi:hypothetical protein
MDMREYLQSTRRHRVEKYHMMKWLTGSTSNHISWESPPQGAVQMT